MAQSMQKKIKTWLAAAGAAILSVLMAIFNPAPKPKYPSHNFGNFTHYKVNATTKTPKYGIGVDDPKGELDLVKLDATLTNIENCMAKFATEPLTKEESVASECYGGVDLKVHPPMIVKVAPDWKLQTEKSKFTGEFEQLFSCDVGEQRCIEKGLTPDPAHPCSCRAEIQDQTTIITVPKMTVFPAMVVTIMTGCLNPWKGRLNACVHPNNVVR